jgi:hypothetical protein
MRSVSLLPVLLLSSLLALACSKDDSGQPCETEANCPARARCLEKLCVADARPVARIEGLDHFVDRALATFDGSDSTDPDAGDAVVGWGWSVRAIEAACEAPAAPPSAPVVHVRFPCVGRWAVDLVVVDALGAESTVATHAVEVGAYAGPQRVTAGDDRTAAHRCAGEPLRCTAVDAEGAALELPLAAAVVASDVQTDTITWEWSVEPPPGLTLSPGRRVQLSPGPDAPSPTATIETDGLAISGQWRFTVEVRDAAGVLGTATQLVTVENSAPVILATVPDSVPHRYDVSRRFIASGEIPVTIVDPDGDPVTRGPLLGRHLNDGPNDTFDVADQGDVLTYYAEVRYDVPEDALHLIGEGVARKLELTVNDVNGAATTATLPIVVGDRPPRAVSSVAAVTTGHLYDAEAASYRATAKLSKYVDDDGDPLFQAGPTGDGMCQTITVDETGQAWLQCALAFVGSPAIDQFAAEHVVQQRIRDPWNEVEALAPASVVITNRPPVVTLASIPLSTTCEIDRSKCCDWLEDGTCLPLRIFGSASATVSPVVTDPDGDPLDVQVSACGGSSPASRICFGGACGPFVVTSCATDTCGSDGDSGGADVRASDGAETGFKTLGFSSSCVR